MKLMYVLCLAGAAGLFSFAAMTGCEKAERGAPSQSTDRNATTATSPSASLPAEPSQEPSVAAHPDLVVAPESGWAEAVAWGQGNDWKVVKKPPDEPVWSHPIHLYRKDPSERPVQASLRFRAVSQWTSHVALVVNAGTNPPATLWSRFVPPKTVGAVQVADDIDWDRVVSQAKELLPEEVSTDYVNRSKAELIAQVVSRDVEADLELASDGEVRRLGTIVGLTQYKCIVLSRE